MNFRQITHGVRWLTAVAVWIACEGGSSLADTAAKQQNSTDNSSASLALLGVLVSAIVSGGVAWLTAQNAYRSERNKRQSDLALQISQLVSATDDAVRRAAMRRFAVAVVKITKTTHKDQQGLVYFVPMNSRVTIGREDDNDIVLADDRSLSRWHCGLLSDQHSVWIDDYASTNGTYVNDEKIAISRLLVDNDVIRIGPFELTFHVVRKNSILAT